MHYGVREKRARETGFLRRFDSGEIGKDIFTITLRIKRNS